jgi:uncharacterized membrane protein YqiK
MGAVSASLLLMVVALIVSGGRWKGSGRALIVHRMGKPPVVAFTDVWVLPFISRVEGMDLSPRRLVVDRKGSEAPHCKDNIRVDVLVSFMVRVCPTPEDVLTVSRVLGARRAGELGTLQELFLAKFAESIKAVFRRFDVEELFSRRGDVREALLEQVGADLNGFTLDDVSLDHLEQTPISALDANNILDAQGILKVTRMIAAAEQERMRAERERELAAAKHRREMGVVRRG